LFLGLSESTSHALKCKHQPSPLPPHITHMRGHEGVEKIDMAGLLVNVPYHKKNLGLKTNYACGIGLLHGY